MAQPVVTIGFRLLDRRPVLGQCTVLVVSLVLAAAACSSDQAADGDSDAPTTSPAAVEMTPARLLEDECEHKSRHVLVVGVDGLRPDAAEVAGTPGLDRVAAAGASTSAAFAGGELGTATEQPTLSGPGWTSILTGVWTDKHGVTGNEFEGLNLEQYPHLFTRLREVEPGARLVSLVHWIPLRILGGDADVDEVGDDRRVTDLAVAELSTEDPTVVFIHLDDVDGAGHASEYSAEEPVYMAAVETADGLVVEMLDAVENRPQRTEECWATVVVTDHGGLGNLHGGQTPQERTIPLVVGGDGLEVQVVDDGPGHVVVPPTVMAYLGLPVDPAWGWDGEAFGVPA